MLLLARLQDRWVGAALPNLIALTSEACRCDFRYRRQPDVLRGAGGRRAGSGAGIGETSAWQTVFWVGGVVPLLLGRCAALAA
jgi:AAHS family 3-hydroxyphenylpropionic acid transporter